MAYDNTNKGALWKKTAKSGLDYISGNLNVEGKDFRITMFNNDKQGNESRPDFNIVLEPSDEAQGGASGNNQQNQQNQSNQNDSTGEDLSIEDIPF